MSIIVYFVLLFCCYASCGLVSVTRREQDIFSYSSWPKHFQCYKFCRHNNSTYYPGLHGSCTCQCDYGKSNFVTAELKCVASEVIRNTKQPLEFKLYQSPNGYIEIVSFDSNETRILFEPPKNIDVNCDLNEIEELSYHNVNQWNSVMHCLASHSLFQMDDDDIEGDYPHLSSDTFEDWIELTLHWNINPDRFFGRLMRINVTCEKRAQTSILKTGVMVFKVNGTFTVPFSSSSVLVSSPSSTDGLTRSIYIESSTTAAVYASSTDSLAHSIVIESSTTAVYVSRTSSLSTLKLSPSFSTMISDFMTIPQATHSLSTPSSFVISSSSIVMGPVTNSKSSSNSALTGAIVAGVVLFLVVVILIVYVLRKRRMKVLRRKHSDLGHINPTAVSSLSHLPALANPLNDGVYENPEVVDAGRRSGVRSIDSAMYDQCWIVENPSATKVNSVYDNIPDHTEHAYKALDPTKREPSAKYQSLIKNKEHEYSTVADSISGAPMQEPLYSEVENGPPQMNGGLNASTPPPLAPRKPHNSTAAGPIYNERENSGDENVKAGKYDTPNSDLVASTLRPVTPSHPATVTEPIYNEVENSGNETEQQPSDNVLEESSEGPVYSVLESNEVDV